MTTPLQLSTAAGWSINPTEDGKHTAIVFKMHDGTVNGVVMGNQDFGRYASRIILEAQKFAATNQPEGKREETLSADPIPLVSIGVARGRSDTEGLLSARLGNLTLVFSVDLAMLRGMCADLSTKIVEAGPRTAH